MVDHVDTVVVGAGVVGLATARHLALAGREVVVLEAAEAIGTGTSSRNSEVIHAGIYYPKDSLKARLCVAGKWQLYEYCASHGVEHHRRGKLIVATTQDETAVLETLVNKAEANGVDDLERLDGPQARRLEPALRTEGALLSPSTGGIDAHGLMLAYQGEAEDYGAAIAFHCPVGRIVAEADGFRIWAGPVDEVTELHCQQLVNAAGLGAQAVARTVDGLDPALVPPQFLAKGSYFTLSGRAPFDHLIYPVPATASLGVHLTIGLDGQARFGPDEEWTDTIDYRVDPARGERFYESVRRYFPGLADDSLQPGYAGIRPKIHGRDQPQPDFLIQGPYDHGLPGLVNLFGIESPGLTASMAIAAHVARLLND